MNEFFTSEACLSGLHCQACRDPKSGQKIRRKWVEIYNPGGDSDFICPYGKIWGYKGSEPPQRPTNPQPSGLRKVARGAKGLLKAAIGKDKTPPDILKRRQSVCNSCDQKTAALKGITTKCTACGCVLPAKQRIASERCPLGKWDNIRKVSLPVLS